MPIRKAPQPEEARKLFLTYPTKLYKTGLICGGQQQKELGKFVMNPVFGAVFKLDMKVVEIVCEHISTGKFTLADREMYKSLPVGLEALKLG